MFSALRFPRKLLALATLAACGAPGADAVFTKGNPKIPVADSGNAIAASPVPQIEYTQFRGYYRRLGTDSRFQPCGTAAPLEITGTPLGRAILRERFQWMAFEQGRKMFGVFQGTIVIDTLKPRGAAADSAAVTTRTRFFITEVDSLRGWKDGDCGGMRIG